MKKRFRALSYLILHALILIPLGAQERSNQAWVEGFNSQDRFQKAFIDFKKIEDFSAIINTYKEIRSQITKSESSTNLDLYVGQVYELAGQFPQALECYARIIKPSPGLIRRVAYLKGAMGHWSEINLTTSGEAPDFLLSIAREVGMQSVPNWKLFEKKFVSYAENHPQLIPGSFFLWVWIKSSGDEDHLINILKKHYPNTLESLLFSNQLVSLLSGPGAVISP